MEDLWDEDLRTVQDRVFSGGRNDAPIALWDEFCEGSIGEWNPDETRQIVVKVWETAEWPEDELTREEWLALFNASHYEKPAETLTIYRGCTPERIHRMAWTTNLEKARWFATRELLWAPEAAVFRAVIPPEGVLCMVDLEVDGNGRSENEIVVDPSFLGEIEQVEMITDFQLIR